MTTVYPYDIAKQNVNNSGIAQKVLKLSGQPRSQSLVQIKKYAERYGLDEDELIALFNKNVSYYQNDYKSNNPDLSAKEVGEKQAAALDASVTRAASQAYVNELAKDNKNKKFVWLPSSAEDPRDLHQQYYGKTYSFSSPPGGILPGEDYNCQCGIKIL